MAAGFVGYSAVCPCERTPGLVLFGTVHEEPVTAWHFANDVPLCQVQIRTGLGPRAMNINCMATPDGNLFLSCSAGAGKYWCGQVGENHPGRLRLAGVVYPVVLNRVLDNATLDAAWAARVNKLQVLDASSGTGTARAPDEPRPDDWWSFSVRSRPVR